ncbi:hypothetical protein [Halococcus salsus]|uniref:hypothetical protein n=1 Tax=Halococcus salsus TaxID=2162894 RepID=UPI001359CBFE|nr:hypothetical protein [Halococcus salsus]
MVLSDERQITRVWDAFADTGFVYVSESGDRHNLSEGRKEREERLPIRQKLLQAFLDGETDIMEFKRKMASEVGRHKLWGFSGFSGQMFFNTLVSSADLDDADLDELLREVFTAPNDKASAASKIRKLERYVKRLRSQIDDLNSAPSAGFIPYFVSYFWQLQDPNKYQIYYKSIRRAFSDLAIWDPSDNLAEDYVEFWDLNEEIRELIESYSNEEVHLWTIERMCLFWLNRDEVSDGATDEDGGNSSSGATEIVEANSFPDSYIPPIVSILPDLAQNTEEMKNIGSETGRAVETLFEDRLAKCLRMLGYTVEERGQGSGRNPDGIARARRHNYAIIYDAKVRQDGYRFATNDERQFRDYIDAEVGRLQSQGFRNVYFTVFSSFYDADRPDAVRRLKIETEIQEVRLIETNALLDILETRLREPMFTLGPTNADGPGIQDLFAESGVLTAVEVQEQYGR